MKSLRVGAVLLAALLVFAPMSATAQTTGKLFVRPYADAYFPLDTYTNGVTGETGKLYSTLGIAAGAALDYSLTSWLYPFFSGGYLNMPYAGGNSMTAGEAQLGLGLILRPFDRLGLRLDAMGGMASVTTTEQSGSSLAFGGKLGISYRLSPALSISADGGYQTLMGTQSTFLSAVAAGLSFSFDLSALGGSKPMVAVEAPKLDAVFPSLYAYYDDNAFGTVKVVNREDAKIKDVKVSFNSSRYMDQPKVCAVYPELAKGESVEVPMKGLFSDTVLQITQGVDAKGEVTVEYTYLGSDRVTRVPIDFRMHHRNAITWSDDRRAAAFVSPTNPAALWFSKFAAGTVRDRLRGDINKPLQYAIGMFEGERLYGLNYVVVPANDYSVKHGLKDYIDSVQFPHQTLQNRGGDCSDLAILFASLMQSIGVDAAFITIPGHIFAAFDTGMSEDEARASFYDPGLLIYKDGRAWIPVEITMVKDGFIKAWRVGAKEYYDSLKRNTVAFYRVPDCWKVYPPAAFPGVNPRFTLPSDAEEAVAFDAALDRFVAREMEPQIEALRTELASDKAATRANEVGILYAHYGMLKDSWKELSGSATAGCPPAWTNLGNVAYLRKNYKLALSYYEYAYKLDSSDDNALLGIARCQYELEDFNSSDAAYASLHERNPELAGKFGYLGSVFGGEGRAWSLSERFASTKWESALNWNALAASQSGLKPPFVSSELPGDGEPVDEKAAAPAIAVVALPKAQAAEPPKPAEPAPVPGAFDGAKVGLGAWTIERDKATQTDENCYFAKLALPLVQSVNGVYSYSFVAKSTAPNRGWVGVGAHLFTPEARTFVGYGLGDSLVVWLTRDPVHFQKDQTRLQLYRSVGNSWMDQIGEVVVPESIYDANRFDVKIDSKAGTISVSLNGKEKLEAKNLRKLHEGRYVVLRALDTAEFSAFKAEAGE